MFHFDVASKEASIKEIEQLMAEPDFWDVREKAQGVIDQLTELKDTVNTFKDMKEQLISLNEMVELLEAEDDPEFEKDLSNGVESIEKQMETLELNQLLSGKYDRNSAIVSLHPGAGGLDSYDWAEMLYRMYLRWSEKKGYKVEILDYLSDMEAGIKSATLLIKGRNAFGYMKGEKGVHRLVRISPFDTAGRRHTSFASVDVLPEIEDDEEIKILPEDLKIDTYRASGAGGQHVNKTDSAVRVTHLPSGIVVQCQNERSQHSNRISSMKILAAKLAEKQRLEQQKELDTIRGEQMDIGWGSQIRSYVFHPYSMVKDHRTSVEAGNAQGVLDGDLDRFIDGYLKFLVESK